MEEKKNDDNSQGVRALLAIIFFIIGIAIGMGTRDTTSIILAIFLMCISVIIAIKGAIYAFENQTKHTMFKHFYGLPVPENVMTDIYQYDDKFTFITNGLSFNLAKDKITDISTKKDKEIQKQYVSSTAGAIGGAFLFGTLGALIGGRVKEKKTSSTDYYLIFSYLDNNEPKYIAFNCNDNIFTANKLAKEYNKNNSTKENINIDL